MGATYCDEDVGAGVQLSFSGDVRANRGTLAPDAPSHLKCAETVALASRDAYSVARVCREGLLRLLSGVTPIDVIERMQIGSRPVHRAEMEGLDGLLPVPWVFAWTQTRHMIPGWYGAGAGLGPRSPSVALGSFAMPTRTGFSAQSRR